MMRVFYFEKISSETSLKVLLEIGKIVPEENVEVFLTVANLSRRLHEIGATPGLLVLSPSTLEELSELVALQWLFVTVPIILILPDQQPTTIREGHLLQPRFLTFRDTDFSELSQVLQGVHDSIAAQGGTG